MHSPAPRIEDPLDETEACPSEDQTGSRTSGLGWRIGLDIAEVETSTYTSFELVERVLDEAVAIGSPALNLPFSYIWFGGIVFLQSPMWLSAIEAWRSPSFLPLAVAVAVITLSQTVFYLRYRYY